MRCGTWALMVALTSLALAGGPAVAVPGADAPGGNEVSVARRTLELVDESRPTPANGAYEGAPERRLTTVISYPTRNGNARRRPRPLVVFATGFGGTSVNYAPLYDHWVRAGYVVAAPTFPLSSEDAPGGASVADLADQPADLAFVTSELLRLNRARRSPVRGLIDPDRVALAGKSLGAITVFEAGYDPTQRVPGIDGIIAMTGLVSGAIEDHFTGIDTPLLLVHGDADTTVPYGGSAAAFAAASPPKFFVTVFGATHGSAFGRGDDPSEQVVNATTTDFLDAYLLDSKPALQRLERDANVPGVASLQAQL